MRGYKTYYTPKIQLRFPKDSTLLHIYHCDGGERRVKWYSRLNILFLIGNVNLLRLEYTNPCKYFFSFGIWK